MVISQQVVVLSRFRYVLVSLMLTFFVAPAFSQVVGDTLRIYFHKESAIYNKTYKDNEARAEKFFQKFNALRSVSGAVVLKVETCGVASPEGQVAFNEIISKARMSALARIVRSKTDYPDSLIRFSNSSSDWGELAKEIAADDKVSSKQDVLDIINNYQGDKIKKLLSVDYGRPYWYIYHNIYPKVRAAKIIYSVDLSALVSEPEITDDEEWACDEYLFDSLQVDSTLGITIQHPSEETLLSFEVKTNALGWGLGMVNFAAEVDIIPHLSVNVPFYYSGGYDYFSPYVKFRGVVLQPEVRYYPWLKDEKNDGFFVGGHLGLGWYNYALNGDYRIQDAGGNRPAFGGGLSLGYKLRFKKHPSWGVEFAIGAGVYNAKYDIFYNEENGPYYRKDVRKTWFGIDNAAVSFFYEFDIKRKGGKR